MVSGLKTLCNATDCINRLKWYTGIMVLKTCNFEGCGRSVVAKGWCKPHYYQARNGKPLKPLRVKTPDTSCSFESCSNMALARGLCRGHVQQFYAGRELRDLRPKSLNPSDRDALGRKQCAGCRNWNPVQDFIRSSASSDGLSGRCKPCRRAGEMASKYNLSAAEYEALTAIQGGLCAICRRDPGEVGTLHVDHDHGCCPTPAKSCGNCVRGLLCRDCNTSIGMIKGDLVRWAELATRYIRGTS